MLFVPLYGTSCGGVKTLKTVGGGACGRVAACLLGRKRIYTSTTKSERRMRLIGVAIVALHSCQHSPVVHAILSAYT